MMTKSTKIDDIKRNWHVIDAADTVLGRMSTKAAELLMGKSKPNFVRYLDCGDHVVIINAAKFIVTGRKNDQKKYSTYSGYPGGMKMTTFKSLRKDRPEEIIRRSISGMLPDNKLKQKMLTRLHIYAGDTHPYADHIK